MGSHPGDDAMKLNDMYEIARQQHLRDRGDWKLEDIQRPIPASGNRYFLVGGNLRYLRLLLPSGDCSTSAVGS